jgi:hypothetical protein
LWVVKCSHVRKCLGTKDSSSLSKCLSCQSSKWSGVRGSGLKGFQTRRALQQCAALCALAPVPAQARARAPPRRNPPPGELWVRSGPGASGGAGPFGPGGPARSVGSLGLARRPGAEAAAH